MSATHDASKEALDVSPRLLDSYQRAPGVFDELLDADGSVKPSWRPVFETFERMSPAERHALQDVANRLFSENGVTFVAQDDAESTIRPWQFATDGGWAKGVFDIPTVGFAPGEERYAHTNRERLELESARVAFEAYPALIAAVQNAAAHGGG